MSEQPGYSIRYPRRVLLRSVLRCLGHIALRLLTRTTVRGRENLPARGPLILVGNHVAVMEVVLMTLLVPWEIEIIGTADIPIDPRFAWIVHLWAFCRSTAATPTATRCNYRWTSSARTAWSASSRKAVTGRPS